MARKVEPQPAAAEDLSAAAQLEALHPDRRLTIAGREIVVSEYSYFDGLEVAFVAQDFIADMHAICRDGPLRYDRIRRLFGKHKDVVAAIAAQSAGVEPEWVRALDRDDAEAFMSAWFGANAGFFVHEVVVEMREDRMLAALTSTGSMSSPISPAPDSATSTASGDTPSDS